MQRTVLLPKQLLTEKPLSTRKKALRWAAPLILLTLSACMYPRPDATWCPGGARLLRRQGTNGITLVTANSAAGPGETRDVEGTMRRLRPVKQLRHCPVTLVACTSGRIFRPGNGCSRVRHRRKKIGPRGSARLSRPSDQTVRWYVCASRCV